MNSSDLKSAAIIAGITFIGYKVLKNIKDMAWAAFGIGCAIYWTGGFRVFRVFF